jgi:chemotaxis protein MotB
MDIDEVEVREAMKEIRTPLTPWLLLLLVIVGGGAAIYWLRAELELEKFKATSNETALKEVAAKLDTAQRESTELKGKLQQTDRERTELAALSQRLSTDVLAKEEEINRLKTTKDQLEEKLKKEIGNGEIRLSQDGGRLRVDLVDKILFDSGDATISKRGEEILTRVGQILAKVQDKQIQVSGHTDTAPISTKLAAMFPTNWELSTARATNVVRFLEEKAAVPGGMLVATGHGPYRPVGSNSTAQGRARNRRIEILLTPAIQPVPKPGRS